MQKREFFRSVKMFVLAAVLLAGVSYVSAQVPGWNPPPANPPQENAKAPLNVSSFDQAKTGGLSLGKLSVLGEFRYQPDGVSSTVPEGYVLTSTGSNGVAEWRTPSSGGSGNGGAVLNGIISDQIVCKGSGASGTPGNFPPGTTDGANGNNCNLGSTSQWSSCFLTAHRPYTSSGSWDAGCFIWEDGSNWYLKVGQTGSDGLNCAARCIAVTGDIGDTGGSVGGNTSAGASCSWKSDSDGRFTLTQIASEGATGICRSTSEGNIGTIISVDNNAGVPARCVADLEKGDGAALEPLEAPVEYYTCK